MASFDTILVLIRVALPVRVDGAFHGACVDAIFPAIERAPGSLIELGADASQWPQTARAPLARFDGLSAQASLDLCAPPIDPRALRELVAKVGPPSASPRLVCLALSPQPRGWNPSGPMAQVQGDARALLLRLCQQVAGELEGALRVNLSPPLFLHVQTSPSEAPAAPGAPLTGLRGGYPLRMASPLVEFFNPLLIKAQCQMEALLLGSAAGLGAASSRPRL
jgi:hypothetical protein